MKREGAQELLILPMVRTGCVPSVIVITDLGSWGMISRLWSAHRTAKV